jgi:hypothetical protein
MLRLSLCLALDSAIGQKREQVNEYGTPDEENPEWTDETFARLIRFKDLPVELQRTPSNIQNRRKARFAQNGREEMKNNSKFPSGMTTKKSKNSEAS